MHSALTSFLMLLSLLHCMISSCVVYGRCVRALITWRGHCVIDSISFSDSSVVMATSKNNIKNAAQPTTAIMMTSPAGAPIDDKDDVIDAKLDSFVDDMDGQYSPCWYILMLLCSYLFLSVCLSFSQFSSHSFIHALHFCSAIMHCITYIMFVVDKWVVSSNRMSALVAPSDECLRGEGLV